MERKRYTTAGVLFWTPAPDRTSSTSTEDAWEEDDEEGASREFVSQMDENGIIGLSEALEEAELEETCDAVLTGSEPPGWAGPLSPEEADCSGCVSDGPPEELSSSLMDHLDHSESAEEVSQELPPCYDMISGLKALTEGEQREEHLPEGVKYLDMKEEDKCFSSEEAGAKKGQTKLTSSIRSADVSNHHYPVPRSASAASLWPHPFHFTAEELVSAPRIEEETFPEMDFTESLPETYSSHTRLKTGSHCPEMNVRASPAASPSDHAALNHNSRLSNSPGEGSGKVAKHQKLPIPLPRKTKQHSPGSASSSNLSCSQSGTDSSKPRLQSKSYDRKPRTPTARVDAAEEDDHRTGPLSYHTPDFSKVKPKVSFPKDGYTPPKSRHTWTKKTLSPEPPLVFKSPAEIVKEVLLNIVDESSLPSDYNTHAGVVNSTVPQEFRCWEQTASLVQQLQEDYNRLLTKYAEAENTIDRLRLEAKVNLYSDPPVAGHSVQSGLNHNPSKYLKLDFPQCQRAEISSTSTCPNGNNSHPERADSGPSSRSPGPQQGQQLTSILYSQTDKFLQQLQIFKDLIKSDKLQPHERVKGLSQLAEGLNSLERGYLLVQDEHKLLQQKGAETCHFDPERELEGLIFQCGLHVEELKEQVEQTWQELPTSEASPRPAPQPSLSNLSDEGPTPTHPQSPPVPLLVDPGDAAQSEMSTASNGDNEEEAEDEEALSSLHHRLQMIKHSSITVELKAKSEHQDPPAGTDKQQITRSSPPLRSQSTTVPVLPRHSRRSSRIAESNSSSLSSLADPAASRRRSCKAPTASRRVPSQDGIISPETDSGFVGSEGSHLTPAAASVLHQRASESVSGGEEGKSRRLQTGPAAAACPSSSSSPSHRVQEPRAGSQLSSKQARRTRMSCSLQDWITEGDRNRIHSRTSEFRLESENPLTGSEAEYADSIKSLLTSCSSSSPAARCHHGDSLRALSPAQVVNYNEAMRLLQAEMTSLKEKVESWKAQGSCSHYTTSTPRVRSGQQRSDVSQGKRETRTADEDGEACAVRPTRKRSASAKRQRAQQDFLPGSKMETSTPLPQPQVDRYTQTSAAPDSCCSHSTTVHRGRTLNQPACSNSGPAHPFPHCHRCPHCPHCPHCGCPEPGPPKPLNCQAARSPDRAGSRYFTAEEPPPPLQCVTVCPPQLLLYPSPVMVSPHNITETSSGARGSGERRRMTRRSLSVDKHHSLDSSLDRAIRAARQMKRTSGHMAHSLAEGLQHQQLLTQS